MDSETQASGPKKSALQAVVPVWTILLVLIYVISGWVMLSAAARHRRESIERHEQRVNGGDPAPERRAGEAPPKEVRVGIYVDRVSDFSIKDTGWTADFYIWFFWQDKDLTPGETFQVVDGEIESKEKKTEVKLPDGTFYAEYRVKARMTKYFNVSRFPADDHLLTIRVEDAALPMQGLIYVPDRENSSISSRVVLPGYRGYQISVVVHPHAYKTTRGDPRLTRGKPATFSQLIYGVWIKRQGLGFFVKVLQGLFAAVAISFLVFFIKPTDVDPRFGLGACGFFGGVANSYITASLLPDTAVVSLADMVNGFGIFTIFLTLVQSTLSLYIFDIRGEEELSKRLDRVSVVIFVVGYASINLALPLVARV